MRLKKSIYIMMAAALGLASCNVDDEELYQVITAEKGAVKMQFDANIASNGQSLSKTCLENGWGIINGWSSYSEVLFESDDDIKVFGKDGASSKFVNIAPDGYSAVFQGNFTESLEYYALYPFQTSATISSNEIKANLSSEQTVRSYSFDPNAAISVAFSDNVSKTFSFQNVTSMISFRAANNFQSITIEATDGTPIAGDFSVEVAKDGSAPVISSGTESKVTLKGDILGDGFGCIVSLLPATIKSGKMKITFTRKDGSSFSHVINKDVVLERGVCRTYSYIGHTIKFFGNGADKPATYETYVYDYEKGGQVWAEDWGKPEEGIVNGWSTKPDGELEYACGEVFYAKESMSLYPVSMKSTKHTITVDCNGGKYREYSNSEAVDKYTIDCYYKGVVYLEYNNSNYIKDHAYCKGFYLTPECDGENVSDNYRFVLNEDKDITLYVGWQDAYYVNYHDGQGGIFRGFFTDSDNSVNVIYPYPWVGLDIDLDKFNYWVDKDGNRYDAYNYFYFPDNFVYQDLDLYPVYKKESVPTLYHKDQHCLKVSAGDRVENPWDNQFWIVTRDEFTRNDNIVLSFDYRADKDAKVALQIHEKPLTWLAGYGYLDFSTEWKHFEETIPYGNSTMATAFAFMLNEYEFANNYYFDNVVVYINGVQQIFNWDMEESDLQSYVYKGYLDVVDFSAPEIVKKEGAGNLFSLKNFTIADEADMTIDPDGAIRIIPSGIYKQEITYRFPSPVSEGKTIKLELDCYNNGELVGGGMIVFNGNVEEDDWSGNPAAPNRFNWSADSYNDTQFVVPDGGYITDLVIMSQNSGDELVIRNIVVE